MEDIIYLLPDAVANQIAAGEVVQRPASVVKELLENAIDAGATQISLIVKDGGKSLIQVIDNGKGMSFNDAVMCFERHATSKLKTADDLFALKTMGFRGEAMASIAAVAQVEMRTCQAGAELGTLIVNEGNEIKKREHIACSQGTNTAVKNLFFNVPARRNFLKANTTELRYIHDEFTRVALAYPNIGFSYTVNESLTYKLPAEKLSHRIADLLGIQYREQMLPCKEELTTCSVEGYVGKPEHAKRTRGDQFFFVNDRFIKSASLHHAVMTAFEGLLPADTFPFYVLKLKLDPKEIDVNVHPTKTEIKFQDEKIIYNLVQIAVKQSLSSFQVAPSINFDDDVNFGFGSVMLGSAQSTSQSQTIQVSQQWPSGMRSASQKAVDNFLRLQSPHYSPFGQQREIPSISSSNQPQTITVKSGLHRFNQLSQLSSQGLDAPSGNPPPQMVLGRYLIKVYEHGLMLINIRSAYERICYEKLQRQRESPQGAQTMLFSQTLDLTPSDYELAIQMQEDLAALGMIIEPFGNRSIIIRSLPADYHHAAGSEIAIVEELLEYLKQPVSGQQMPFRERMLLGMAKQQAARMQKPANQDELEALIQRLLATSLPHYTPDGKPTMIMLDGDKLESVLRLSNI